MTLRCEHCGELYDLPKARSKQFRLRILFFAVCPHCGTPRIEESLIVPGPRCGECNVPIKAGDLCHAHYMQVWRKSHIEVNFIYSVYGRNLTIRHRRTKSG